jgi:hypothetical protein
MDGAGYILWRWSGVRHRGQADGGKAKRASDCACANHFLQDHHDPLSGMTVER